MTYVFGVFEFDSGRLELRKAGRPVALEPQPARALSLLLQRAGETVSREDLSAHIWGDGTHVDFNRGLAYCVGQIRGALGDEGDNPRFIQTLPKRGFKFIAPVTTSERIDPAPNAASVMPGGCVQPGGAVEVRPRTVATAAAVAAVLLVAILAATFGARAVRQWRRPIVAVSIFDNETGDRRYDLAVHRLSDSVVDQLTRLGPERIGVVGNAAVLRIPRNARDLERIASQTGASHVILAQLQPSKGDLSLLMHLIRLDDGTHLWTRRIARPDSGSLNGLDEEAAGMIESGVLEHILSPNPQR
jgi:DNA-binding winged helix-turn-helix (wHTH) protein/TolB-like protein